MSDTQARAKAMLLKVLQWVRHTPGCGRNEDPQQSCTCGLQAVVDTGGELIDAAEAAERADTPADDSNAAFLIFYDDRDRKPEVFWGTGSTIGARRRFEQISGSWNAHLFERIATNSTAAGRCFSAGCKKVAQPGGLLCEQHYNELPPALRGE